MKFFNNIEMISVDLILDNPYNMISMTDSTFEALKKNITDNGFFGAIIVRPHPLKKGKFEIVDGEKRFHVLQLLDCQEVPCIVVDFNDLNSAINMIRFNREHGYFNKEKTQEVVNDLIRKTNKLFVREKLSCGLKEFDNLLDDSVMVFEDTETVDVGKYSNIVQKSEKNKKLFY